ncbi:MAG: hypothetical protein FXF49_04670 [Flexistipes sinusarabici]|uniref:Pyruvate formate lyase-activating protein n=1 Tax=Flexistipes sinusarabici TaxID=2352 RepID=A0A5D0MP46_FLESI|nr:DUF1786 domain-containing protein [Flexistipes sinusarabici]TYB33765.1 MAG: hypothetical protein FXF49_04670 [Flexistipes sinusarabici]
MSYLAIDIGAGTQDVLMYKEGELLENSPKLIFPSPTKLFSEKIKNIGSDLFISGGVMGGGPITKALRNHINKGYNVFISKDAARTIKDDLKKVESWGFHIVEAVENPHLELSDIDFGLFEILQKKALYEEFDKILVAVQDHGFIEGQSDRITRIDFLKKFLDGDLSKAFFDKNTPIPQNFSRFRNIREAISNHCKIDFGITDTGIVAALGALYKNEKRPAVTIDVGNGHTFAALIHEEYKISSFFEHHTGMLDKKKIRYFVNKMIRGKLTNEEIFNDGGHGAHRFSGKSCTEDVPLFITGPNRHLFFDGNDGVIFASPAGDTMITGSVGLLMQQNVL